MLRRRRAHFRPLAYINCSARHRPYAISYSRAYAHRPVRYRSYAAYAHRACAKARR